MLGRTLIARLSLVLAATALAPAAADAQNIFRRFVPVERVAADPNAQYGLKQSHGPWLIMAATFTGEGAEQQANQVALELRQRLNANAYVHDLKLELDTTSVGRGVDKYGKKKQMKYRSGDTVHEWAVLVGDFTTVDDPEAQRMLDNVKRFEPDALRIEDDKPTFQTLAYIRRHQEQFIQKVSNAEPRGPMRTAFITRNPLLPQEYFVPKGVDKFVADMNKGVKHSLLDMKGRYTVKVATFAGKTKLQTASLAGTRSQKKSDVDPLVEAAENAHLLTEEMRRLNIEAYEFHDRYESYVAVGSYDEVAKIDSEGRLYPTQAMMPVIRAFGAAYNTPSDPLQQAHFSERAASEVAQVEGQMKQMFQQKRGPAASGLNPKFARIPPKDPNARVIPFDIHPHVIEAPKRSISGSFSFFR